VIDNTTAYVEHPELVAQRIAHYTRILGNDRVIAGVDCGFATWASHPTDVELTFAKLESLVAGAAIASRVSDVARAW
jgi:5-methyltetrahydropteroyltriglutamate--homocysteine methyltransferase